jgi:REP element-mobilizing transposase RayT
MIRRRIPVHVTLRMRPEVWNLRSRRCYAVIKRAFYGGKQRFGFRLIEFSVLGNHVHLIVEVDDTHALTLGTQGLEIRMARRLNRVMDRRGKVFADRYHARVLRTPTEVRRAVHYVVQDARKHYGPAASSDYSSPSTWVLVQARGGPPLQR